MTTATVPSPRTESGSTPAPRAWLTQLLLDPSHRGVQADLGNTAALHRRVMSLVPDGLGDSPRAAAGVLFRLDTDRIGRPALLVQTRVTPNAGNLPTGYADHHTRDMTPMLTALRPGLRIRYRFLGNAVRRCGPNSTAGAWKQAIPLHDDDANQWWTDRATAAGLTLHTLMSRSTDPLTAYHRPTDTPQTADPKPSKRTKNVRVPHAATLFEGTATIHDPATLREALLTGIGRGKSYGCGLLSLAPAAANI